MSSTNLSPTNLSPTNPSTLGRSLGRSLGRRARLAALAALGASLLLGVPTVLSAGPAGAQTTTTTVTAAAIQTIVNIPGQLPNGVTGYRVEFDCSSVPGYQNGIVALISYPPTGGTATASLPLANTTSCKFRLFVLGTGPRSIFGNAVYIGGAPRAVTFPTVVNNVTYDANTVLETEVVPLTTGTTVIFGQVPVATTTTTTTTLAPTTTAAPTTTRPPAAPVTAAPPTSATPTTAVLPPVVATSPTRLVRIKSTTYEVYTTRTCRSGLVLYVQNTTRKRCATTSEAKAIKRVVSGIPAR